MKKNRFPPKISVVMPVYNVEKFLDESIQSVLNQTFRDFEFIIIINGVTDSSLKIVEKYSKSDERIKIVSLSKPGVQKALNKGLKLSKGKYIARMDGDDISHPRRFEIQHTYLENNKDIFLVGSSAIVIDEGGKRLGVLKKFNSPKNIKRKFLRLNTMIHPSIMFRNTQEFFYREKFRSSEDYDLYLRMLTSKRIITNLPRFLIKYRISKNSFVSTMPNQHYYLRKSKEFYYQRKTFGKDDYEKLSAPKNKIESNFETRNISLKIMVGLQDGKSKEVRKNLKVYYEKYGFQRWLLVYYLLSLLPKRFLWSLQRIF